MSLYDGEPSPGRRLPPGIQIALLAVPVVLLVGIIVVIAVAANRSAAESAPLSRSEGGVSEVFLYLLGFLLGLAYLALIVFVAAWLARDAAARGMESGSWTLIFVLPHFLAISGSLAGTNIGSALFLLPVAWLGLPIYLLGRRRGSLATCDNCGNRHLSYRACPHCGVARRSSRKGIDRAATTALTLKRKAATAQRRTNSPDKIAVKSAILSGAQFQSRLSWENPVIS